MNPMPERAWRDSRPKIAAIAGRPVHLAGAEAKSPGSRPARLPSGLRVYAIGDVHGRADLVGARIAEIESDLTRDPPGDYRIILLGDYVDRGPASRKVIDILIAAQGRHGERLVLLKGNHEELFLEAIADVNSAPAGDWVLNGGMETLESYFGKNWSANLPARGSIENLFPPEHVRFLKDLRLSHRLGDFLFVHAGIDPQLPWNEQERDPEILLWIRSKFLDWPDPLPVVVVHGHTPQGRIEHKINRLNIDTRAYRSGNLSCVRMENDGYQLLGMDGHG